MLPFLSIFLYPFLSLSSTFLALTLLLSLRSYLRPQPFLLFSFLHLLLHPFLLSAPFLGLILLSTPSFPASLSQYFFPPSSPASLLFPSFLSLSSSHTFLYFLLSCLTPLLPLLSSFTFSLHSHSPCLFWTSPPPPLLSYLSHSSLLPPFLPVPYHLPLPPLHST